MGLEVQAVELYRFGLFEADVRNGRLLRSGTRVKIQDQPFRVLLVLLRRAGEIVMRDELRQELWPSDTYVEFDGSLNAAFKKLRYALGDSADNPTFIETVPKRGYRFIAPVERAPSPSTIGEPATPTPLQMDFAGEASCTVEGSSAAPSGRLSLATAARLAPSEAVILPFPVPKQVARRPRISKLSLAAVALVAAGVGIYALWPARAPRMLRTAQLTHFGRAAAAQGAATDGARIYFCEARGGHFILDQVSVTGGEPTAIPLPFNAHVLDISPDHTELLVGSITELESYEPLWIVPLAGGSPRRLGDAAGEGAAWSPEGQTIAYARGPELHLINADGTGGRRLASVPPPAQLWHVRWSPRGRILRFTMQNPSAPPTQWEMSADGSNLHPLPRRPQAEQDESEDFGSWTPDGRYFVYRSFRPWSAAGIWATRDTGFFRKFNQKPVEVYEGPQLLFAPLVSADGKKIFFIGDQERRELVRYDAPTRQFVPYLSGIFARLVDFTKDGQWMAYNFSPGFTLWVSRPDGSERRQLSFPPMQVYGPCFSPDGRLIAVNWSAGNHSGIILFPTTGDSKPERVTLDKANGGVVGWSRDGTALYVWRKSDLPTTNELALYLLDLKTWEASRLPGSEGLHHGLVSPNGLQVAALSENNKSVMLYDLQTHRKIELAHGTALNYPCWSHDSKAVFFQDILEGSDTPIYRAQIDNQKVERVTNLAQPFAADVTGYRLTGITPDDQLLATLIRSNSDLYALDVDFP